MSETEQAAMARVYVNTGWQVFPVWWVKDGYCACPDRARCASPAKHPIVPRGVHQATQDAATVTAWWTRWPQANIGLPAGANNLAVLDVDPRHGGVASLNRLGAYLNRRGTPLPSTLTAATGGGGYHLVYAAPAGGVKGGANAFGPDMPGLDTRGRGGYVVAPPSRHVSGTAYSWLNFFAEPVPWPDILSTLMDPPQPQASVTVPAVPAADLWLRYGGGGSEGYAAAALAGEVERVRQAAEGARNATLNVAAFNLGTLVAVGMLDADQVANQLEAAAVSTGLSLAETRATVRSGLRSGARHPRDVAAVA